MIKSIAFIAACGFCGYVAGLPAPKPVAPTPAQLAHTALCERLDKEFHQLSELQAASSTAEDYEVIPNTLRTRVIKIAALRKLDEASKAECR